MVLPLDDRTQFPERRNSGVDHIAGFSVVQAKLGNNWEARREGQCGEADAVLREGIGSQRTTFDLLCGMHIL